MDEVREDRSPLVSEEIKYLSLQDADLEMNTEGKDTDLLRKNEDNIDI